MTGTFISPYAFPGMDIKLKQYDKVKFIINTVCKVYNVEFKEIDNEIRERDMVIVRQTIMWFIRKYTGLSLKATGCLFKRNYDHATILYGTKVYENVKAYNELLKVNHQLIIDKIESI